MNPHKLLYLYNTDDDGVSVYILYRTSDTIFFKFIFLNVTIEEVAKTKIAAFVVLCCCIVLCNKKSAPGFYASVELMLLAWYFYTLTLYL